MGPTLAPRRKSCQALLTDEETHCTSSFRGWGKYCLEHLEECAKLTGQYKDASARVERLRRTGELSQRQVRAFSNEATATKAAERVQQYSSALEDETSARTTLYKRFPAEKDERHTQRLAMLEERRAASAALISQLHQRRDDITAAVRQRRERHGLQATDVTTQGDLERRPLLGYAPRSNSCSSILWWIVLSVILIITSGFFAFTIWTGTHIV